MRKSKWIATKKEVTVDTEGKETPDKITYERIPTNWLDLTVKTTGAIAIFVPLLLLFFQRCNNTRTENAKAIAQLYTGISIDLEKAPHPVPCPKRAIAFFRAAEI